MNFFYSLLTGVLIAMLATPAAALSDNKSIMWAGCGITKRRL